MSNLWLPRRAQEDIQFRKEPAPKTGPSFGPWAGRDLTYMQLPGGAVVQFDLSRLQLSDYREMRSHYQVGYNELLMSFMIHQGDWSIECKDQKIADAIEEIIRPVWTMMVRGMAQAFWAGYSPMVMDYENNPQTMRVEITRFKDLLPEECSVNWREVVGTPTEPNGVPPKLYYYDGIAQSPWGYAGGSHVIPPEYTLWYPLLMENGDYCGRKLLKPAFIPWFFSTLVHLFANRYFERFGEPTPIGRYDSGADLTQADGSTISGQEAMFAILQNLRSQGVVALPNDSTDFGNGRREFDFDIKYLESQMRGADFERYLLRLDEEISLGMFTPVSVSHVGENASHNTVQVHMQAYLWSLNALMGDMKYYIDTHVIRRIKEWNFGAKAPTAYWVPRQLGKDNVETLRAIVAAGVTKGSLKPDAEELGTAIGLKMEEIDILAETQKNAMALADHNAKLNPPVPAAGDPTAGPGADPRVNRQKPAKAKIPKSGDSGVIRPKIAARVKRQATRAYAGKTEFRPDWGFQAQLAEASGDPEAVAAAYARLDAWAPEAFAAAGDAQTFGAMLDRVLESQFEA